MFLGSSWGLYFSLLKIAVLSGIPYIGIATLTTAGVCIGMLAIGVVRNRKPDFSRRNIVFYIVCALLGYLVPMIVELMVIGHMPASVLTLIVCLSPMATLIFARLMRTDTITKKRIGGMVIGMGAIFVVLFPDAHNSAGIAWHWLILATVVPCSYALYHNYISRYWPEGADSFQVACGEAIFAALLLIVFSIFFWRGDDIGEWNSGYTAILIMATIALVDIYIYFEIIRLRGPIYVSQANYFMVISGVIWGMILFSERLSPWLWLSVALLVISLFLVNEREKPEEPAESSV
jgi:drug/metabolite transporter (DMT)-like permease